MFKAWFYTVVNKLLGKNLDSTPMGVIIDQMNEKRPLPIGATQFEEWSDRIISGTLISATAESQKFALADMLTHLKPTEDHECDAYFVKSLRKFAVNETAFAKMKELKEARNARMAAEAQKDAAQKSAPSVTLVKDAVPTAEGADEKVLAKPELQSS